MFPSYVLSNLFVKNSLKNTGDGFIMKLKNTIDSGTITGLGPLTVDEKSFSTDTITLTVREKEIQADQITNAAPVAVYILNEIEIAVEGESLSPGEHRIGFIINTREAGRLQFTVTENLSDQNN